VKFSESSYCSEWVKDQVVVDSWVSSVHKFPLYVGQFVHDVIQFIEQRGEHPVHFTLLFFEGRHIVLDFKVCVVVCKETACHRHRRMLVLVPTMRQKWDILSI